MMVSISWIKFENVHFWPKLTKIRPFLDWSANFSTSFSSKFWKIVYIFFNRKKNILGEDIHILALMTHLMSPLSTHLQKFEIPKNWRFSDFLANENDFFLVFSLFSWIMVSIVDFFPYPNWPDFYQKFVTIRSILVLNGLKRGFIRIFA